MNLYEITFSENCTSLEGCDIPQYKYAAAAELHEVAKKNPEAIRIKLIHQNIEVINAEI